MEAMRTYTSLRAEVKKERIPWRYTQSKCGRRPLSKYHQVDRSTQEDGRKKNQNQKTAESGKPKMDLVLSWS